jgi:hypothetical protein
MTDSIAPPPANSLVPANETERLAALHRYRILDTSAEVAFDRITALAARLFKVPTVLISLVDESRAWFKSSIGFDAREVPRDDTLCSFAVLSDEPLSDSKQSGIYRRVSNSLTVNCSKSKQFIKPHPSG